MSSLAFNLNALAASAGCDVGHHIPSRQAVSTHGGIQRTMCTRCRCSLMRTAATRTWIRSGLLG